jgi:hypothetical protein
MSDIVDETLRLWRTNPFRWGGIVPHVPGVGDCLLSIGEYIAGRGGLDIAARFRGSYSDEAGAMGHVQAAGGAGALIDLTGLPHTDNPGRGDVVLLDTGSTRVGALCTGPGVAARLERGVIEVDRRLCNIVRAWKVDI